MARRDPMAVWIRRRKGKRGVTYGLRWADPVTGRGRSEACGTDLAYARQRRQEIRQELRDGLGGKLPEVTIAELIERLPSLMAGKASTTIARTQESLAALEGLCKVRLVRLIDRATMLEFRAKRLAAGKAIATVNKDARQIRSALSYCVDAGLLKTNPLLRWKGLETKHPEKPVRVVEEAEFKALTGASEDVSFRTLLVVGYRAGLRRGELIHLRWNAVDLARALLHVVNVAAAEEFTKSRKNRAVPLHPEAQEALSALYEQVPKVVTDGRIVPKNTYVFTWPDGKPYKPDWVSRTFAELVKKAKIDYCTPHDLRRSFSTIAQRAGVDRSIVKDLGGWSDISVVEKHYTGDVSGAHRRAMARIANTA